MCCFDEDLREQANISIADFATICDEMKALKEENAKLCEQLEPQKVLKAEEVIEPGVYILRDLDRFGYLSAKEIDAVDIQFGVTLGYEYFGPIKMPGVK